MLAPDNYSEVVAAAVAGAIDVLPPVVWQPPADAAFPEAFVVVLGFYQMYTKTSVYASTTSTVCPYGNGPCWWMGHQSIFTKKGMELVMMTFTQFGCLTVLKLSLQRASDQSTDCHEMGTWVIYFKHLKSL